MRRTVMANRIVHISSFGATLGATLGLLAAGCTQLEKTNDGMGEAGVPADVQRAFNESCATVNGCHVSGSTTPDLSPTASAAIVGGMSSQSLPLVEIGNVQGSYLALKLLPNPPGLPMPPTRQSPNDATNVAIILGWIAGAQLPEGGSTTDTPPAESTTDAPAEDSSTTASEIVLCGLEEVAPTEPNPFDIGTAAGQIPPDVGNALSANCGCHEVDSMALVEGAFPYGGTVHFSTLAEFQADSMGRPVYEVVLERVVSEQANRMPPPYYCDLGDGTTITADDKQLLTDWLTAGAPDATTWMP